MEDRAMMKSGWLLLLLLSLTGVVPLADATDCSPEHVLRCRQADADGSLELTPGGGVCKPKSYVHYTHLCTVTTYLSGVDFCCCVLDKQLMCCRYQYQNSYFMCEQGADNISRGSVPGLEVLLPAILIPLAAIVFTIVCVVKCVQGRKESGGRKACCTGWIRRKPSTRPSNNGEASLPLNSPTPPEPDPPLSPSGPLVQASADGKLPSSDSPRLPSAPPLSDLEIQALGGATLPPYCRADSEPAERYQAAIGGPDHPYYRSRSADLDSRGEHEGMNPGVPPASPRSPLTSVAEPPPSYDEHHHHPLFHPEENAINWF